jgi:hypothetical protein
MRFIRVIRVGHARAGINNGDGNAPKVTASGELYGSSQSAKRQAYEAAGLEFTIKTMPEIAKKYVLKYDEPVGKEGKEGKEGSQEGGQEGSKHTILWDDALEDKLNKAKNDGKPTIESLYAICGQHQTLMDKIKGRFNTFTKDEIYRLDGCFGSLGHLGFGSGGITRDRWVLGGTVSSFGQKPEGSHNLSYKDIAHEETYWSEYIITLGKYSGADLDTALRQLWITVACETLQPRANRNAGNLLSLDWSISTIGSHACPNIPARDKDMARVLDGLINRNRGRDFEYIGYKPEQDTRYQYRGVDVLVQLDEFTAYVKNFK